MTSDESRLRLADTVKSSLPELERQILPLVSQSTS